MGMAMEVLAGFVTNAGTTLTAQTVSPGDSMTVRNAAPGSDIFLLNMWGKHATAGKLRLRSPRMHDNVNGYQPEVTASDATPLMPPMFNQKLFSQDALILESTSGGADSSASALLLYYKDIPGLAARLATSAFIDAHMTNLLTVQISPVSSATIGTWASALALNSSSGQDNLKANTDYGVLGYMVNVACTAITFKGPDTGNLRVGGPGIVTERELTARWFQWLSDQTGLPCIPILNSANKAGTTFDAVSNTTSVTAIITLVMAELH